MIDNVLLLTVCLETITFVFVDIVIPFPEGDHLGNNKINTYLSGVSSANMNA